MARSSSLRTVSKRWPSGYERSKQTHAGSSALKQAWITRPCSRSGESLDASDRVAASPGPPQHRDWARSAPCGPNGRCVSFWPTPEQEQRTQDLNFCCPKRTASRRVASLLNLSIWEAPTSGLSGPSSDSGHRVRSACVERWPSQRPERDGWPGGVSVSQPLYLWQFWRSRTVWIGDLTEERRRSGGFTRLTVSPAVASDTCPTRPAPESDRRVASDCACGPARRRGADSPASCLPRGRGLCARPRSAPAAALLDEALHR